MSSSNLRDAMRGATVALLMLTLAASVLAAESNEKILVAVGHCAVVPSVENVRTVVIAEPDIADAAVGSDRTVVVTAKTVGSTNLVVYNEGGRYRVYDIETYVPNGTKQVLLHCTIAEMTDQATRELGLDFVGSGTTGHRGLDGTLGGGLYTTKVEVPTSTLAPGSGTDGIISYVRRDLNLNLATQWRALEAKGDIRTLANPSLLTTSGEKASFLSGGEFAYQIISGSGVGAAPAIAFKEFGVRLEFTPVVQEDGSIRLKVAPEVSEPDYSRSIFGVPPLTSRKASTTVTLNPGEYLIIGGLKQTDRNKLVRKIPILGQIPVLGALFTYYRNQTTTKELMVVVSPELVEAATTMPALPTEKPNQR